MKFEIDLNHRFVWHTVQEFGHVLNYLSINERLPANFHPVSPPPYLNGGSRRIFVLTQGSTLVIECHDPEFHPGTCAKWLEGRLPNPVNDLNQWENK